MKTLEKNIVESFRMAKNDIIKLQSDILALSQTQERIMEMIDTLAAEKQRLKARLSEVDTIKENEVKLYKSVKQLKDSKKKAATKRKATVYVSTKDGKKFHKANCPFAKNIKPKNKVKFHTKTSALNKGLKPCNCVR